MPEASPETPTQKWQFWISLILPPVVTVAANLFLGRDSNTAILFFVPWISVCLIIGGVVLRIYSFGKRYQRSKLWALSILYIIGQIIICTTVWFASCLSINN